MTQVKHTDQLSNMQGTEFQALNTAGKGLTPPLCCLLADNSQGQWFVRRL